MNRFRYWYHSRGRKAKNTLTVSGLVVCLVCVGIIGYMLLVPKKVEVRYGTIVRDPVDGHVWEDHTKTLVVATNEAGKYIVRYVDKLSPEHQQQEAQQQAQKTQEENQAASTQVIEPATPLVTADQLQSMRNLQQNVDTIGQSIIDGMTILNGIVQIKPQLVDYRNRVAAMKVAPALEPFKQKLLGILDKYIQACDLYVQAVVTGNVNYAHQANALIGEAAAAIKDFIPSAKDFKDVIDEFIKIIRQVFPF